MADMKRDYPKCPRKPPFGAPSGILGFYATLTAFYTEAFSNSFAVESVYVE